MRAGRKGAGRWNKRIQQGGSPYAWARATARRIAYDTLSNTKASRTRGRPYCASASMEHLGAPCRGGRVTSAGRRQRYLKDV